jgi:WD40 repeat protein
MRRFWMLFALGAAVACTAAAGQADDRGAMSAAEIKALQQRLAGDDCYRGAIDGRASKTLRDAINACPWQQPVLRIETGTHVAEIRQISVDSACQVAATGSDDKTVRVWSLTDGSLRGTLRLPIGPNDAGKIYAVAISPDGKFVAAGGWDAQSTARDYVYVFKVDGGEVVARIGPFGDVIHHLAFSPNGRWLAATSTAGVGLRVIDTANWGTIAKDDDYAGDSYGAGFAPDSNLLYTVAYDGKLRQYNSLTGFTKQTDVATKSAKEPYSVAVDPQGSLVAVGFSRSQAVDIYIYDPPKTLRYQRSVEITKDIDNGDLSSVAWSSDGARLIAGGRYRAQFPAGSKSALVTFNSADGKSIGAASQLSDNTIFDIETCKDKFALATADPAFGLVDKSGNVTLWPTVPSAPDMRGKRDEALTIAPDGKQVRFGLGYAEEKPVVFDLEKATVEDAPNPLSRLEASLTEGMSVSNWQDNYNPTFGGKPIALEQYERSRSLATRVNRSGFVLGTDYYLRAFDAGGNQLWRRATLGVVWGVNISDDGCVVVAAYGDGTIRWHRWSDGAELLALFVKPETKAWVAWTPSSYYAADNDGEKLIGWQRNRGWNQAPEFLPASEFHDKYFRPDILKRALDVESWPREDRRGCRHKPASARITSGQ